MVYDQDRPDYWQKEEQIQYVLNFPIEAQYRVERGKQLPLDMTDNQVLYQLGV